VIERQVVAARLAAVRITRAVGPLDGPLTRHYQAWHAELTEALAKRFTDLKPAELFVTCTANAQSELLVGSSGRTIVHDQHLGRTLNRMTYFVVRDWPASRVQAWAFERIATATLGRGDLNATQLALALSSHLGNVDDAPDDDAALDAVRALIVTIEEFFVLAHEVAHSALGAEAHANLEKRLGDELDLALARDDAADPEHEAAIADQMARDIAQAVSRHIGGSPSAEDLEPLREMARGEDPPDEAAWLRGHKFLYEEVACDLIATELTLEHFHELDAAIDLQTVLPAILMALHNLTSLEYLRTLAEAESPAVAETLRATTIRKSVWRRMTRSMYEAESPEPLGPLYVAVTQDHAHKLGDQVLFIVPTTWREARATIAGLREDKEEALPDASKLHEIVWSLAQPANFAVPES
jgi:hypothetical protein